MRRVLYLDCIGGAAGDMLLGALLDAGADAEAVRRGLRGLGVEGLELVTAPAPRHGIAATHATIRADDEQPHRHWRSIRAQLDAAGLPARPLAWAQAAFAALARAEGKIHGIDPQDVHFHEVGAVDAIGEVCGVALALDTLAVDRVVCSPLPAGRGLTDAAHGKVPLPAPATLELLAAAGAPLYGVELAAELVTPTGAALVTTLAAGYGPLPPMTVERSGYGAGTRDPDELPNVVRAVLGRAVEAAAPGGAGLSGAAAAPGGAGAGAAASGAAEAANGAAEAANGAAEAASGAGAAGATGAVTLIEATLDDLLPELAPDASAAAFAAGALDVWTTPVTMKHGRPGFVLHALARPRDERAVARALLRETSTLGIRLARHDRIELEREHRSVRVGGREVRVKLGRLDGELVNVAPEHADCEAVARALGEPVKAIWARALAAAYEALA